MTTTEEILARLVAFDTTSHLPNLALIDYIVSVLDEHGVSSTVIPNDDGTKANVYCTIGPKDKSGVMLSGHTDVVPVQGQEWTRPAFELTKESGRLYGRGTTDMKGFVACALSAAIAASKRPLITPLHLAFSYDEEIGCVGVRSLLALLKQAPVKPSMCIVGEPTSMQVATQHKGKMSVFVRCIGREGHSALAPNALNAIHLASDLISVLRNLQKDIQNSSTHAAIDDSEIPYTTIHVGGIKADQALNIVPNLCTVNFEIRHTADDDPLALFNHIQSEAHRIVNKARHKAPEANIEFDVWNAYPGLNTPEDSQIVRFVKGLTGAEATTFVAFGTEGGLFSEKVGIPTVVCGPGSMEQGHKPDEFIAQSQMQKCAQMLTRLVQYLETGDAGDAGDAGDGA